MTTIQTKHIVILSFLNPKDKLVFENIVYCILVYVSHAALLIVVFFYKEKEECLTHNKTLQKGSTLQNKYF